MGLADLSNLYREVLFDHAQNPRNYKTLANPTHHIELLNPTCGDAIVVEVIVEDDVIQSIAFNGNGCSISIASASMMTEVMKEKTLDEALALVTLFNRLIKGEALSEEQEKQLKDAYFLENIKQLPARYKCAVLAWKALESAVLQEESE